MEQRSSRIACAFACATFLLPVSRAFTQSVVTRMNVDSAGAEANAAVYDVAISGDGAFVGFDGAAWSLVANDNNSSADVFVHELATGLTTRVSVDSSGNEHSGNSWEPSLSADGRFVAFWSFATLVAGDTNLVPDVFVFDRSTGTCERVSVDSAGKQANSSSSRATISADGNVVAFWSHASNLVAGDTNNALDLFVHDRVSGSTTRVNVDASGKQSIGPNTYSARPSLSKDGSVVVFESDGPDLVAGDTNGKSDVFVVVLGGTGPERVSVDSSGAQASGSSVQPTLSRDGRFVAFGSDAADLVAGDTNGAADVFLRDRASGTTTRVSVDSAGGEGDGRSQGALISGDGTKVAFSSAADDLVAWDPNGAVDLFLHDLVTGETRILSADCAGNPGNDDTSGFGLSDDGGVAAFASDATDLVANDNNHLYDAFAAVPDRTDAAWSNYGQGFAGTLGVPSLVASADPAFGASLTIDVGNSLGATTPGLLLIGDTQASIPTRAGGTLLVVPRVVLPVVVPAAGLSMPVTIPRLPELCGVSAFLQAIELDPGALRLLSFTPGLALAFGH
jgi:Tol biopolymer transport system component